MAVDPVSTATATQNTSTAATTSTKDAKDATLNYDSFLKLLVAQMKNQDPTDPIDASQQMSQLATFSSVEQAIKTNRHLESLIQETSMSQAASLIGKTVTSTDGDVKGVVKAVEIKSDGLTAILENGEEVLVTTGITISATAAANTNTDTGDTDTAETDPGTTPDDGETESVSGE
ncbi:MAG: flagellar hook assembly protein FlgD [Rhizobiaceae bacterium]|nr:flagellar hook assembly protein FlgD [Rhizobiaceae bacterium]